MKRSLAPNPPMRSRLLIASMLFIVLHHHSAWAGAQDVTPGSMVTAESRFGNGTVTGLVRDGRNGLEVRLPGGTWIECADSCSETLRLQTVDFWEAQNKTTNRCGLLGCLELRYPQR